MSRRVGTQVVNITTLGQRDSRSPRRRIPLGAAVGAGVAILVVYAIVALVVHIVAATFLWIPALIVAGYAVTYARRRNIVGFPRLLIGIVVLVAVHYGLIALIDAL